MLVFFFWAKYVIGYFYTDQPESYFEEFGFVGEVVWLPVVYYVVYAPVGLFGGALIGFAVKFLSDTPCPA